MEVAVVGPHVLPRWQLPERGRLSSGSHETTGLRRAVPSVYLLLAPVGGMVYIHLMRLQINGDEKEFADGLTLADLVAQLGMKSDRVAVELNRDIVARSQWVETSLHEGDRLEIVHFVGGG